MIDVLELFFLLKELQKEFQGQYFHCAHNETPDTVIYMFTHNLCVPGSCVFYGTELARHLVTGS